MLQVATTLHKRNDLLRLTQHAPNSLVLSQPTWSALCVFVDRIFATSSAHATYCADRTACLLILREVEAAILTVLATQCRNGATPRAEPFSSLFAPPLRVRSQLIPWCFHYPSLYNLTTCKSLSLAPSRPMLFCFMVSPLLIVQRLLPFRGAVCWRPCLRFHKSATWCAIRLACTP